MIKKKHLSYIATVVVSVGITAALLTSSDNSAQDAADYASKTCKVAPR